MATRRFSTGFRDLLVAGGEQEEFRPSPRHDLFGWGNFFSFEDPVEGQCERENAQQRGFRAFRTRSLLYSGFLVLAELQLRPVQG